MRRFFTEAFAVLALALFIASLMSDYGTTGKTVSEIVETLEEEGLLKEGDRSSGLMLRRFFGLEEEDYEGVYYSGPKGFMDVDDFVIIKDADPEKLTHVMDAFRRRIAEQEGIFASYAPEQMDLLSRAVVWEKGEYAVLVIGHEEEGLMAAVRSLIER